MVALIGSVAACAMEIDAVFQDHTEQEAELTPKLANMFFPTESDSHTCISCCSQHCTDWFAISHCLAHLRRHHSCSEVHNFTKGHSDDDIELKQIGYPIHVTSTSRYHKIELFSKLYPKSLLLWYTTMKFCAFVLIT
jgi:hypothetical protein